MKEEERTRQVLDPLPLVQITSFFPFREIVVGFQVTPTTLLQDMLSLNKLQIGKFAVSKGLRLYPNLLKYVSCRSLSVVTVHNLR